MSTATERKLKYIQAIINNHPIYTPDSAVAKCAERNLYKLSEQTLFYLYHCKGGLT